MYTTKNEATVINIHLQSTHLFNFDTEMYLLLFTLSRHLMSFI